jgi:RNA polymerase sigma-70 factor, ECF subfamily
MRRYAVSLIRDQETADDMVQDSLERALKKQHLWHRQGSLRGWLFRILYRRCMDHYRKHLPDMFPAATGIDNVTLIQPANQEMRIECIRIGEALDRLPVEQRALVLMAALEGLSYDEMARITGVPIGTVRSRLARGRETLRNLRERGLEERQPDRLRIVK